MLVDGLVRAAADASAPPHTVDDNLSRVHKTRDLVDTVPYSGLALSADGLIKALLGGINRRLDRKSTIAPGATGSLI